MLEKYKNIVWINRYYRDIYSTPIFDEKLKKLDELYFIDKPDVDVCEEIINFYQEKNNDIVSSVYLIEENSNESYKSRIISLLNFFKFEVEKYNVL